jgi:hypothetical protein
MAKRLSREELVHLVGNILHPKGKGFSSEEISAQLDLVCINCPDPVAALDIIIETPPPVTAEELVARALACPPRDVRSVSESELHPDDPLRHLKLDP